MSPICQLEQWKRETPSDLSAKAVKKGRRKKAVAFFPFAAIIFSRSLKAKNDRSICVQKAD